jgi:site-specific DNA-methyltransferase (cytosine-N4-specific)
LVLDPFAGSNTTGFAAEKLERKWIAMEINEPYLYGSKIRFEEENKVVTTEHKLNSKIQKGKFLQQHLS